MPLDVLRPDLPGALGALLLRTLSANPHLRPASARALQEELRSVFDGPKRVSAPVPAEPNHTDVTVSAPVDFIDEASADHPNRTLRPPTSDPGDGAIDVDVDIGEPSAHGGLTAKHDDGEEEETATMDLTPELRARIEAMTNKTESRVTEEGAVRTSRPPAVRSLRPSRGR